MPSAVPSSVSKTVRSTPSRAPSQPQASLPAAPPAKIRVRAMPIIGMVGALRRSTNGRKARNPMRVPLSSTPIASSSGKAPRWRGCVVPAVRVGGACGGRLELGASAMRARAAAAAGSAPPDQAEQCRSTQRRAPRHHAQQPGGGGGQRHLSQVAGEIIGPQRAAGCRVRHRPPPPATSRSDAAWRAGAADQQGNDQHGEAGAGEADGQIGATRDRGAEGQQQRVRRRRLASKDEPAPGARPSRRRTACAARRGRRS